MLLSSYNRLRNYITTAGNSVADNATNKTDLMMWLTAVSRQIEQFLNRDILIQEYTQIFDITYSKKTFQVTAYPIQWIRMCQEDSTGRWNGSTEYTFDRDSFFVSESPQYEIELLYERGYVSRRALRVYYTGGLAYDATKSSYTMTSIDTGWTGNNYAIGASSGACGQYISASTSGGVTSIVLDMQFGSFTDGETINEYPSLGGTATGKKGVINSGNNIIYPYTDLGYTTVPVTIPMRALCETNPEIVTACEMQVRYNWKNKMTFENTSLNKDSVSKKENPMKYGQYPLQPEVLHMLNPYRRYAIV